MTFVSLYFILLMLSVAMGEYAGFRSTVTSLITGLDGVADDAIYATSEHNYDMCAKNNIRIDAPPVYAWCMYTPSNTDFIQIEFRVTSLIKTMVTLGRGSPSIQYIKTYHMMVSFDGVSWSYVTDSSSNIKVFPANTDTNTLVEYDLEDSIVAKHIRVLPQTWYSFPSFKLEAKGYPCEIKCDNGLTWKGIHGYMNETLPVLQEINDTTFTVCARSCYSAPTCGSFVFLSDVCLLYTAAAVTISDIQNNAYPHIAQHVYFFKHKTMCCALT